MVQSVIIYINNPNFSDWNPKSINTLITLLSIPEATQLKQSNFKEIGYAIGLLEKIYIQKMVALPRWLGNFILAKDFQHKLDELKEISKQKSINVPSIYIPTEFDFIIPIPEGNPKKNTKDWIKWCFALKLLIQNNESGILDKIAMRGLLDKKCFVYPNKKIGINLILQYYQNKLPNSLEYNFPKFPKYLPPYLEMEQREELWSIPKKAKTIQLHKEVWFHILAFIAKAEEINEENCLIGINGLIGYYKENNDLRILEAIGNCLELI